MKSIHSLETPHPSSVEVDVISTNFDVPSALSLL
jgi:hypothetical protein